MWQKLKNFIQRNRTSSIIALSISGFFLIRYLKNRIPLIKLSYFVIALKNNAVEEVVVQGDTLFFRGIKSANWFKTNIAMVGVDKLYTMLLDNTAIEVSCLDDNIKEKTALVTCKKFIKISRNWTFNELEDD